MDDLENPKEEELKPEVAETKDGGVEVSLEEPIVEQKEEPKPPVVQPDIHLKNKVFAQERIITRLEKQIGEMRDELRNRVVTPAPVQQQPVDDLDELVQKDWKGAVRKISEDTAKAILLEQQKRLEENNKAMEASILQEKNTQSVLNKHPELSDESTEKSQIFKEILAQHSERLTSVDGPLVTMYEMENELRRRGYDVDGIIDKRVESERDRLAKANASLPSSRATNPSNKIVLTKEQREFCDENGISYEVYARTQRKISGGGIEL